MRHAFRTDRRMYPVSHHPGVRHRGLASPPARPNLEDAGQYEGHPTPEVQSVTSLLHCAEWWLSPVLPAGALHVLLVCVILTANIQQPCAERERDEIAGNS